MANNNSKKNGRKFVVALGRGLKRGVMITGEVTSKTLKEGARLAKAGAKKYREYQEREASDIAKLQERQLERLRKENEILREQTKRAREISELRKEQEKLRKY